MLSPRPGPRIASADVVRIRRLEAARLAVYDYLLGGKDDFAADRAVGDQLIGPAAPRPGRRRGPSVDVLGRVRQVLVGKAGLRQLLDIGSGLPTAENVHEVAHRIDPARPAVVYIDNRPRSCSPTPRRCSPTTR